MAGLGGLRGAGDDGDYDDGRCRECEARLAVGPCAACHSMICADCGVESRDPTGIRVICYSCARLVAGVDGIAARRRAGRPSWLVVVAVAVIVAFTAVMIGVLAGCSSTPPRSDPRPSPQRDASVPKPVDAAPDAVARMPSARLIVVEPPRGKGGLTGDHKVAARLFLFADSQIHYLFGKRTFAQSPFADRMAFEVAIRPAPLDESSDLILEEFLREWRENFSTHQLIFLGDATDISCTQEWDTFAAELQRAGIESLLGVTANHEGFFVGNFTSRKDLNGRLKLSDMPYDWTRACANPGSFDDNRLTKGRSVQRWLQLLPRAPAWATSVSWRNATGPQQYKNAHLYYVRPLGGGDAGAPPVWGVFLDTVDYLQFNLRKSKGAGSAGAVSRQQLRFLDRAMFEARGQAAIGKTHFIVFGHHPISGLERKSKKRVLEFLDARPDVLAYVSAHTHASKERLVRLPSGRRIQEIVIGSTTDAPNTAGLLEVHVAGKRVAVESQRLRLDVSEACRNVAKLPPTVLGYTGYRIQRDATPDPRVGILDGLAFKIGLTELEQQRVVQMLGSLIVENELVRSWANLYLGAPIPRTRHHATLEEILSTRYRAGDTTAALRPWLEGRARPHLDAYDAWQDPAIARVVRIAEHGVHRFGPNAMAFRALRALRRTAPEARQYFLCHAVYAAEAESKAPHRAGDILYIR